MPTTTSATKALRQNLTKASRNRHFVALYKEVLKKFEKAIKSGSAKDGKDLLSQVYSAVDTLAKKNIIHTNNASRKKSKFAKTLKALSVKA